MGPLEVRRATSRTAGRYTRAVAKTPPPPPRFGDLDFEPGIPPEPETQQDPFGEDVPLEEATPESYGSMLGRAIDRATTGAGDDPLGNPALADLSEVSGASYSLEAVETGADSKGEPGGDSDEQPHDPRFGPPLEDQTPGIEPDEPALALDLSPAGPSASGSQDIAPTSLAVAGPSAPVPMEQQALDLLPPPSPSPVAEGRRGFLFDDPIANLLGALAIGLFVAVLPAQQLAKGVVRDRAEPLLVDLEESIDRPLAVRAGELEKPAVIANRIEDGTKQARSRFFMIWLAGGLTIGVGGGLLRRSA